MEFLKKRVVRGSKRSEDTYFSLKANKEKNIYWLKISSKDPFDEMVYLGYLKLYLDECIKANRLLSIDDLNPNGREVN